jgi:hypothetical protein
MKPLTASILASLLFVVAVSALAIEQPRVIPRSQEIHRPVDEVFDRMKQYFSNPSLSHFRLMSADPQTHTIVAKQNGISDEDWSRWAYCQTGPMQMISKLQDGSALVTLKLQKSTPDSTFASAAASFEGTYGLGDKQSKVECTSKFVLEDNILAAAGPGPK